MVLIKLKVKYSYNKYYKQDSIYCNMNNMNNMKGIDILKQILLTKTHKNVASYINVAVGTVKRWEELNNIPDLYRFELMKMAGAEIDYSVYSFKEKDQFFTPSETAEYCYQKSNEIIGKCGDDVTNYTYVEPSAGNGNFLKVLPLNRRIGMDIEPRDNEVFKQDFLDWDDLAGQEGDNKYIVIGNPPFGLRGHLALKFINHSASFADYVCFILPQLFESDGKGVPRKRVVGFNLIHSEKIKTDFTSPDGKSIKVECIFQVWSKHHTNDEYNIKKIDTSVIKIYSLSDGGTPSTTRNKKMFDKCDVYIPSTCFGKNNMRFHNTFNELPRRKGYGIVFNKNKRANIKKFKTIDWSSVAFLSTNSAYNIRTSQIASMFSYTKNN